MKRFFTTITGIALVAFASAQQQDTISVKQVEEIIKVLASDSLKGRGLTNGGADMASAFIQEKFKEIGLIPAPGHTGYKQEFTIKKATYTDFHADLDGDTIPSREIAILSNKIALDWTQDTPDIEVVFIGPRDDVRRKLDYVDRLKKDRLVVIDKTFRMIFNRIALMAQNEKYYMDTVYQPEEQPATVFLLSDITKFNKFSVKVGNEQEEIQAHNLIGILPGKSKKEEYVIFSTHYDGMGYVTPSKGDSIANGADDGGSSTTAVLNIANWYKQRGNERSLMFVAFSAQKAGSLGSQYFAASVKPEKIVAMINIDMIGKQAEMGPESAYLTGYRASDLPKILREHAPGKFKFRPDPHTESGLFSQSDNYPLALLGIPAHTVSTFQPGKDLYLNGPRDDMHTIYAYIHNLTDIINAIAISSQPIVDGRVTPGRIDERQLNRLKKTAGEIPKIAPPAPRRPAPGRPY